MLSGSQTGGCSTQPDGRTAAAIAHEPSKQALAIRGGSGLGDAIYVQSVARYFVERGHKIEVCCDWPDVFRPLGSRITLSPFRRERISNCAHYAYRRERKDTTQFEDCCICAGIREKVDLRLGWQQVRKYLPQILKAKSYGRPIVLVQLPRAPFGRADGYGLELLPDCNVIQKAIDLLHGDALVVQVGNGKPRFAFERIDVDLVERTSVRDLLDVANIADGFIGYCSFFVPLSESVKKPGFFVWSRAGLASKHALVRTIQPDKIFTRPHTAAAIFDDCSNSELEIAVLAFRDKIASSRAL